MISKVDEVIVKVKVKLLLISNVLIIFKMVNVKVNDSKLINMILVLKFNEWVV